jgi:hypothetical protein
MRTQIEKTAEFGEFVAAAFDGAAAYSTDPVVVCRLATGAVELMLRQARMKARQSCCNKTNIRQERNCKCPNRRKGG